MTDETKAGETSHDDETIKANRLRWIAALEGYEYLQTVDHLRDNDGFCCLGVACDVLDPKGWSERVNGYGGTVWWHTVNCEAALPEHIRTALGLSDTDPMLTGIVSRRGVYYNQEARTYSKCKPGDRITACASWWNDDQGKSFEEIAAMLREQFNLPKED